MRVIARDLLGDGQLEGHALFERLGGAGIGQALGDDALHTREFARLKQTLHVRRQRVTQVGKINQHGDAPLVVF